MKILTLFTHVVPDLHDSQQWYLENVNSKIVSAIVVFLCAIQHFLPVQQQVMEIHLLHCYIEMTEKAGEQFCHLLDWRAMVATTILLLNLSHMHFLADSPACFIRDLSIIYSHVLNSFTKYSLNYIILCSMEERRSYMFWKDMRRNK